VLDATKVAACTSFFQALYPQFQSCQELIPVPVYASPVFLNPPNPPVTLSNAAAISGVVTGATSSATVFASSTGCQNELPTTCNTSAYNVTTRASAGNATQLPVSPNSFLSDPTGARVWMGSDFGAQMLTPSNFGSASSPFTSLGTVTGKILATSLNGAVAAFSDTKHTPNQVYIVNSSTAASPTTLAIPSATMAAFTPDGLKAYIVGSNSPTSNIQNSLYIYSPLQAPQGPIAMAAVPKAIAFSPNGAFTYVAEAAVNGTGTGQRLDVFSNCNNQLAASLPLAADPILMKVLPALPPGTRDSSGKPIPDGAHILILDSTGFDVATTAVLPPAVAGSLCPQQIAFLPAVQNVPPVAQRIELNQGTLHPLNFFFSADNTELYVVQSSSSSILIYSFINGSVIGGIPLQNDAVPLTADISPDAGTIVIAASDGMLHQVSTGIGGSDSIPISFPNIPNFLNPFCSFDPGGIPCTLNVAQAKP